MGRLRGRLEHLESEHGVVSASLLCPECGKEFVVYGDAPLEFLVAEWAREVGEAGHRRETPEDIAALFEHEHEPSTFVEKRGGLPFLSRAASGISMSAPPSEARDED